MDWIKRFALLIVATACVLLLVKSMTGCKVCKPGTMRCDGLSVYICQSNGHKWRKFMDCTKLKTVSKDGAKWRCCCESEKKCRCTKQP